ncbi:MAG: GntP family permease [Oscillospiraceae bacterium]
MTSSVVVSLIVLIIAVAIYVLLTVKGTSPIIGALIATAIVSCFAIGGFFENFFSTFTGGMAGMLGGFFLQFGFGTLFGKFMDMTGAADRVGKTLMNKMGEKNLVYALMIATMLLAMTGAPHFALMPPLCYSLMKNAKLPRYIGLTAVAGAGTAATCLPGCMTAADVLPAGILGTTIYDGADIGILACVIQLILVVLFVNHLIKKAKAAGLAYDPRENEPEMRADDDMPNFFLSLLAIFGVIILCAIFVLGCGFETIWAVVFSTTIGMLYLLLIGHKYVHCNILTEMKDSIENVMPVIVSVLAVCGFASVVANTAVYQAVVPNIMSWSVHPAVIVVFGTMLITALCADPISGVIAFSSTVGTELIAGGANAAMVYRLASITSYTFDTMPHGGAVTMAMRMFGYDIKHGYKYLVAVNLVTPVIYSLICMVYAVIRY